MQNPVPPAHARGKLALRPPKPVENPALARILVYGLLTLLKKALRNMCGGFINNVNIRLRWKDKPAAVRTSSVPGFTP